ncbi:hypothetical protein [Microvirga subterranea]|uniref:Uncharacterized protein n=1 Tax=Microvirga subterranea TaxID=186651 RepID=A0A370HJ11_9HYPH|nr:hypothetical protein [Microvirga subterranea]RDI58528.1 hypothetical protein DES45_10551 [Microvirga subterranea]
MLAVVFIVNGTLPGLLAPTTAQLFWTIGFAQSFINDGFSIFAHNFGAPQPAAISFGLAGALPASAFLKLGLSAADAYAASFALWLTVAFGGAYKLTRRLGGETLMSLMSATVWCTMQVVWYHHGYSMLALGIALLPFYFYSSVRVLDRPTSLTNFMLFLFTCLVSVFMDGYTYMMFAVATGFALLFSLLQGRNNNLINVVCKFASIGLGLLASYVLYVLYIGQAEFDPAPLDFFRGWGANLEFFLIATKGFLFLPDLIGLSDARAPREYFGDSSVFQSTFSAAIIIAAIYGVATGKGDRKVMTLFGVIALFGFYMALGPSVKFLTYRPEGMGQLMPESYGWLSTGSSILSEHLPGFKNMRASYRWMALGVFGCWAILAIVLSSKLRSVKQKMIVLLAVLVFNIPALGIFRGYLDARADISSRDAIVQELAALVKKGENIAFLPYRNDFLVNYLASKVGIKTYNIGGDKNLASARENWPDTVKRFTQDEIDPDFLSNVRAVLENEDADAVVLPYIDLLWAAHSGPLRYVYKDELSAIAAKLDADPRLSASYSDHFAVIRLNPGLKGMGEAWVAQSYDPRQHGKPIKLERGSSVSFTTDGLNPEFMLHRGWSRLESKGIWSTRSVSNVLLELPKQQDLNLRVELTPFVPRPTDRMTMQLVMNGNVVLERTYVGQGEGPWRVAVENVALPSSILSADGVNVLEFKATPLLSPTKIGIQDPRTLGVMLHRIGVD